MEESILLSICEALGLPKDYQGFNTQIILAINSALMTLGQLGIGPTGGFQITGVDETWTQLLDGVTDIEATKNYVLMQTRLTFDPPTTAHLLQALKEQITETGWRLMVQVDPITPTV